MTTQPAVPRQIVVVEVGGRRLEVSLPGDLALTGGSGGRARPRKRGGSKAVAGFGDAVTAPMQGTVVKVAVSDGDPVHAGDLRAHQPERRRWRDARG